MGLRRGGGGKIFFNCLCVWMREGEGVVVGWTTWKIFPLEPLFSYAHHFSHLNNTFHVPVLEWERDSMSELRRHNGALLGWRYTRSTHRRRQWRCQMSEFEADGSRMTMTMEERGKRFHAKILMTDKNPRSHFNFNMECLKTFPASSRSLVFNLLFSLRNHKAFPQIYCMCTEKLCNCCRRKNKKSETVL